MAIYATREIPDNFGDDKGILYHKCRHTFCQKCFRENVTKYSARGCSQTVQKNTLINTLATTKHKTDTLSKDVRTTKRLFEADQRSSRNRKLKRTINYRRVTSLI